MKTTDKPVEDARSDEGSVVEDSDNTEVSDDEDFVKKSHNDYEAVSSFHT